MACGQFDGATIQADVLNIMQSKVLVLAWQLDNAIDKYYNEKMLEKTTMQIER